jgi:hypothetical protein
MQLSCHRNCACTLLHKRHAGRQLEGDENRKFGFTVLFPRGPGCRNGDLHGRGRGNSLGARLIHEVGRRGLQGDRGGHALQADGLKCSSDE